MHTHMHIMRHAPPYAIRDIHIHAIYTCTPINNKHTGHTGVKAGHLPMWTSAPWCQATGLCSYYVHFHLNNDETRPERGTTGFDKLYKNCIFLILFLVTFKDYYTSSRFLSIDESMISFKGRLSFFQYLPKKPGSYTLGRRDIRETVNWWIGCCWIWLTLWGYRGKYRF